MTDEYPVLIIGGGVVGLTTALFLERCGLRALLVERHPTTSIHPRARGVNGRTMELMRELDLEQQVRNAGEKLAPAVGLFSGHNLKAVLEARGEGGFLLKRMRKRGLRGDALRNSPCGPSRCPQDELEPVLLTAARTRGVDVRLFTELESLEQVGSEVRCTILDRATGSRSCVRARYVIAADGARSKTRERLGIGRSGEARGTHQMNLYFRADLRELVRGREFSMCLIEQPGMRGLFTSIDNSAHWVLHISYDPERGERPEDFVPERCIALIRAAAGVPELEVQLKGALPWESATRIADRYRDGRVFLAGDAAHVMPPWGGFGANTGIQDGHNLAWKLAAVLDGTAGERLLDSYEAERRPVALDVGAIAASMNDARGLMELKRSALSMLWTMRKIFPYLGVGYGYSSEAIAAESGRTLGPGSTDLKGRPGTRVPHVWLEPSAHTTARLAALGRKLGANGKLSSLDLVGREHVLFAGPDAAAWCDAAQLMAADLGVELHVVRLGSDVRDRARKLSRACGIGGAGASLIRPDGFVAWRSIRAPRTAAAAREAIERVLRGTLARDAMPVVARAS